MRTPKKTAALFLVAFLLLALFSGCGSVRHDIIILYTNDVHCAIDENIGYSGLVAYKKAQEAQTPHVLLADCGDALQGAFIGTVSHGEYPARIMKEAGYDLAVLGNHEFDYGMERISELMSLSGATFVGCNLVYTGDGENKLSAVRPYLIQKCGDISLAFIGVSTPESVTGSTPRYFMDENGDFVYGFCGEDDGNALYNRVQQTVDECREKGADYVIVLSHLGDNAESSPFASPDLISHTTGIDVLLDGHSHSVVPCRVEKNLEGGDVLLSSTGTGLANIGQLVITADGHLSAGLISNYAERDSSMSDYIATIQSSYESDMLRVVARSETALPINDADGIRLVRNRETAIGNLCADAFRAVSGADIAFVNGGGIRADLPAGEITYENVIALHPYGNTLCVVEATGQELLDCLEMASRFTESSLSENGNAVGESGGFMQVSGLHYSIDTALPSSVTLDENGMFLSVDGAYRVRDVFVESDSGEYLPLDPDALYTLASNNFILKDGGDGISMFADNTYIIDRGMSDYQVLLTYIAEYLDGNISASSAHPEGRIHIVYEGR